MSNYLLECTDCKKQYVESEVEYLCTECSTKIERGKSLQGVLKVVYDYETIRENYPEAIEDLNWWEVLWPYREGDAITRETPLRPPLKLRAALSMENLWLKDDTCQLSGSYKDRASYLVAERARENNIQTIVTASTGNAASSLAAVAADEELEAVLIVPESTPKAKLVHMAACGGKVIPIKGTYDDAYEVSLDLTKNLGWYNRNTAYNPYTVEGKKTAAFEIWEQLNRQAPDVVIVPTGDGAILAGVAKGFVELEKLGWIVKRPRIIAVQPDGSSAIVKAFENGIKNPEALKSAKSIADSLVVAAPRNGKWALQEIKESNGLAISVSDNEIMESILFLGSNSGVFAEPAAAAGIAGLRKLLKNGNIEIDDIVVVLITGTGLKDVESAFNSVNIYKAVSPDWEEVKKTCSSI